MKSFIPWYILFGSVVFFLSSFRFATLTPDRWIVLGTGIAIFVACFIPWGNLSFGNGPQYAGQRAANSTASNPAPQGPSTLHTWRTAMKPYGFGIAGFFCLLVGCAFAFAALHADEPLGFALIAFAAAAASGICVLVQTKTLEKFVTSSKALAWTWMVFSLFAMACFYMYARQEGHGRFESLGFWLSLISTAFAFLATQGKLKAFLQGFAKMIGDAYANKIHPFVTFVVWMISLAFLIPAVFALGKFDAFLDNETMAFFTEVTSTLLSSATVLALLGACVWVLVSVFWKKKT
jgi:hypothetical protein